MNNDKKILDLPDKVTLNEDVIESFDYDAGDVDDESLQECIDNYLKNEYGCAVEDYSYGCDYDENDELIGIDVYNIKWNLKNKVNINKKAIKPKVVVTIENGMVANIYSNIPNISVEVLDMDDTYDDVVEENQEILAEVESDKTMIEIY